MKKETNFYWRKIQFLPAGCDLTITGRESLCKTFLKTAALRRKIVGQNNSYSLAIFMTFGLNFFLMTIAEKIPDPENKEIIIGKAIFRIIVVLFSRLFQHGSNQDLNQRELILAEGCLQEMKD